MRVYHDFFWYPDPDQRFLMRIRIRPNDTDPDPKHCCQISKYHSIHGTNEERHKNPRLCNSEMLRLDKEYMFWPFPPSPPPPPPGETFDKHLKQVRRENGGKEKKGNKKRGKREDKREIEVKRRETILILFPCFIGPYDRKK